MKTLEDIEVYIMANESTDRSMEILKTYAAIVRIIVDKKKRGYGIGMNIGLDKTTGEYVGIVGS